MPPKPPPRADNGKQYAYIDSTQPTPYTMTVPWRLPPNVSCDNGCMLQWWVRVASACTFRLRVPGPARML